MRGSVNILNAKASRQALPTVLLNELSWLPTSQGRSVPANETLVRSFILHGTKSGALTYYLKGSLLTISAWKPDRIEALASQIALKFYFSGEIAGLRPSRRTGGPVFFSRMRHTPRAESLNSSTFSLCIQLPPGCAWDAHLAWSAKRQIPSPKEEIEDTFSDLTHKVGFHRDSTRNPVGSSLR